MARETHVEVVPQTLVFLSLLPPSLLPTQSSIEQVKSQTEQLSREVRNLMEKNNQMQQLLMKLAEKQGIHLDPEEARRQQQE